jgi:hypothetical protein
MSSSQLWLMRITRRRAEFFKIAFSFQSDFVKKIISVNLRGDSHFLSSEIWQREPRDSREMNCYSTLFFCLFAIVSAAQCDFCRVMTPMRHLKGGCQVQSTISRVRDAPPPLKIKNE